MKKVLVILIVIATIVTAGLGISIYVMKDKEKTIIANVEMQIIQYDAADHSNKIKEKVQLIPNEKGEVDLSKYGKNMKVLEINDETIKISRDARRYEIISQTGLYEGETREYTETIVQDVKYGEEIPMDIDQRDPLGPDYSQARYSFSIRFRKI